MNIHHIRCRQFPILICVAFCSTRSRVLIFEFELTCRDWLAFFSFTVPCGLDGQEVQELLAGQLKDHKFQVQGVQGLSRGQRKTMFPLWQVQCLYPLTPFQIQRKSRILNFILQDLRIMSYLPVLGDGPYCEVPQDYWYWRLKDTWIWHIWQPSSNFGKCLKLLASLFPCCATIIFYCWGRRLGESTLSSPMPRTVSADFQTF
jgi:hypothetical protein